MQDSLATLDRFFLAQLENFDMVHSTFVATPDGYFIGAFRESGDEVAIYSHDASSTNCLRRYTIEDKRRSGVSHDVECGYDSTQTYVLIRASLCQFSHILKFGPPMSIPFTVAGISSP